MSDERPSFRRTIRPKAPETPEELFHKLPNRSFGYLRQPQAEVLQRYMDVHEQSDVSLELPTGTGKTLVGLLVAEWRRRKFGQKVAFLTQTNQLAGQVLLEAEELGIPHADLRGDKNTRNPCEEGRYKTGRAVGVTTYSNLFNVNPVIQSSNVLILDDAHSGQQTASGMWTVQVTTWDNEDLYLDLFEILRPAMSDIQYQSVTRQDELGTVHLVHVHSHPDIIQEVRSSLDVVREQKVRFPWSVVRDHLHACLFLVSASEISIRPIVPPTHTHEPFSESTQRIYMSATLGGVGDLERGYGVRNIKIIPASRSDFGKRYIFIPGLILTSDECLDIVRGVWNRLPDDERRALLLAPSFRVLSMVGGSLIQDMDPVPVVFDAKHIQESLDNFTGQTNAILALAGRYDGLDLPGDDCHMLVMIESPSAIGSMERHLRDHWRLGPILRRKERTRLIQGMGRCTRDATDYAVVFLLGQSLVDSATTPALTQGLPGEIQRELQWGIEQCEAAGSAIAMRKMILGLLLDKKYRAAANEDLEAMEQPEIDDADADYEHMGGLEVNFSRALWEGAFGTAYENARRAADEIQEKNLSGYLAWWLYLAFWAALQEDQVEAGLDSLRWGRQTGINPGFFEFLIRRIKPKSKGEVEFDSSDIQAEAIWRKLEQWGWKGRKFRDKMAEMKICLASHGDPTAFHMGLEVLGECLGAEVLRPTSEGSPDCIWIFSEKCYTFEAKTNKKDNGTLSKNDVQQTAGHPDWLKAKNTKLKEVEIQALVVGKDGCSLHPLAVPHAEGLHFVSTTDVTNYSENIIAELESLRSRFGGRDFAESREAFKTAIQRKELCFRKVNRFLSSPLSKVCS